MPICRLSPNRPFLYVVAHNRRIFTEGDRKEILARDEHAPLLKWRADLAPRTRVIRTKAISRLFDSGGSRKGPHYLNQHSGPALNWVSLPLFLRNFTRCLCYRKCYCGFLCAEGAMRLYEKRHGAWVVVKTWGDRVS